MFNKYLIGSFIFLIIFLLIIENFNAYKEKIRSLRSQQTKLAENNFKLESEIKYLRKQCDSYKTQLDSLKSQ